MILKNPVITASGTFGYGFEYPDLVDPQRLGAYTTKAITKYPTEGHPPVRIAEVTAGMLTAIGLQNVGLDSIIKEKIPLIGQINSHCIVNIAGSTLDDFVIIAKKIEKEEVVSALELNISCPNVNFGGMLFGQDPDSAYQIVRAVKEIAPSKTIIPKLTPNSSCERYLIFKMRC